MSTTKARKIVREKLATAGIRVGEIHVAGSGTIEVYPYNSADGAAAAFTLDLTRRVVENDTYETFRGEVAGVAVIVIGQNVAASA